MKKNKNHVCAFYDEDCELCNPSEPENLGRVMVGAFALIILAYIAIILLESTFPIK